MIKKKSQKNKLELSPFKTNDLNQTLANFRRSQRLQVRTAAKEQIQEEIKEPDTPPIMADDPQDPPLQQPQQQERTIGAYLTPDTRGNRGPISLQPLGPNFEIKPSMY